MSAFVRFEAGELAFENWGDTADGAWVDLTRPWPVPASAITEIRYDVTNEPGGQERTGYVLYIAGGPATAGMGYVWLGTRDALWNRLNGLGPVGLDAARLSSVLQALLVELDAEQVKRAKPTGLAEQGDPQGTAIATLTRTEIRYLAGRWGYIDGDAVAVRRRLAGMSFADCTREVLEAKRAAEAYGMNMDPAAGLSLEEAIEAGLVMLEREADPLDGLLVTWVRAGTERSGTLVGWSATRRRIPWPVADRAAVQHEEPELWAAAVETWEGRPEWPLEQAGEGAA